MPFDYSRLRGIMRTRGKTQEDVSSAIKIKPPTFSQKLNNKSVFKQDEIKDICDYLSIPYEEISSYFFTPIV